MTARLLAIPITIILLALLAACGGGSKGETEATAMPTVKPTPTIEPTPTLPYTPYTPAIGPVRSPVRVPPVEIPFGVRVRVDVAPEEGFGAGPLLGEITVQTQCQYDEAGQLVSAVTTISVPPIYKHDLQGQQYPLIYAWSASNGSITGSGPTAAWTRSIASGRVADGEVTLIASDGIGGDPEPFEWGLIGFTQCQ